MSYTNVPIAAAGDWIDDSYLNTYLGDNFRAIFSSLTGAGQLLASTSSSILAKVPVTGNAGYVLTEDPALATKMKFAASVEGLPAGGTALQYLRKNAANSAKEWATLPVSLNTLGRRGGSATDFNTFGTTNYTPTNVGVQFGSLSASITGGYPTPVTTAVTFPVAFSAKPLVYVIPIGTNTTYAVGIANNSTDISTTGFTVTVSYSNGNSGSGSISVFWFAIGTP